MGYLCGGALLAVGGAAGLLVLHLHHSGGGVREDTFTCSTAVHCCSVLVSMITSHLNSVYITSEALVLFIGLKSKKNTTDLSFQTKVHIYTATQWKWI